jgi:hypothetical protein
MMKLAPVADKIARKAINLKPDGRPVWEQLRDYCDDWTDMDLYTLQLDMLTDMVLSRVKKLSATAPPALGELTAEQITKMDANRVAR